MQAPDVVPAADSQADAHTRVDGDQAPGPAGEARPYRTFDGLNDWVDLADRCFEDDVYPVREIEYEYSGQTLEYTVFEKPHKGGYCPKIGIAVLWLNSPGDTTFAVGRGLPRPAFATGTPINPAAIPSEPSTACGTLRAL